MALTVQNSVIIETAPPQADRALRTNVHVDSGFALCDENDPTKQIKFEASQIAKNVSVTFRAEAASADTTIDLLGPNRQMLQYAVPTTGQTVTISAGTTSLIIEPAGALDALTVVLPLAPANGTKVSIVSTQNVTTLTLSDGADSTVGAATALTGNAPIAYQYRSTNTTWYRCA